MIEVSTTHLRLPALAKALDVVKGSVGHHAWWAERDGNPVAPSGHLSPCRSPRVDELGVLPEAVRHRHHPRLAS